MRSLDQDRWLRLLDGLEIQRESDVFGELCRAYSEPHRAYHNCDHIVDCLEQFDLARELSEYPDELECAIWFHDAIYDVHGSQNEQLSADWAERFLSGSGLKPARTERVVANIMATLHDGQPTGVDQMLMVDVDCRSSDACRTSTTGSKPKSATSTTGFRKPRFDRAVRRSCSRSWTDRRSTRPNNSRINSSSRLATTWLEPSESCEVVNPLTNKGGHHDGHTTTHAPRQYLSVRIV